MNGEDSQNYCVVWSFPIAFPYVLWGQQWLRTRELLESGLGLGSRFAGLGSRIPSGSPFRRSQTLIRGSVSIRGQKLLLVLGRTRYGFLTTKIRDQSWDDDNQTQGTLVVSASNLLKIW